MPILYHVKILDISPLPSSFRGKRGGGIPVGDSGIVGVGWWLEGGFGSFTLRVLTFRERFSRVFGVGVMEKFIRET